MADGDRKAKAVGINHVALEVGDVDGALAFYGRFLDFEVTSRNEDIAFIYFGDQWRVARDGIVALAEDG